jgi:S-methylmethionine-dependent homocysteine/selenocysteine methylase
VSLHGIRADLDPPRYLAFAQDWLDRGASIVGGCCGIGPEHIAEIRRAADRR